MDYLKKLLQTESAPPHALLFFEAMSAFVLLKQQCFSTKLSDSGYEAELKAFHTACLALPIRKIPLKMHLIIAHLDRFIKETGRGLGADSEQALEAAHYDFDRVWQRYFVRDVTSERFAEQLLRAVATYNASHIPFSDNK